MPCSPRTGRLLASLALIAPFLLTQPSAMADPGLPLLREQQREMQEIQRDAQWRRLSPPDASVAPDAAPSIQSDHCWPLNDLRLAGNTLVSRDTFDALLAPLLHPCMSDGQINEVLKAITAHYLQQGYLASRPYLASPPQAGGPLEIQIVEGFVESVEFDDPDLPLSLSRAFPDFVGRPLRLGTLEQGLAQMNRLHSIDLNADLEPGDLRGGTRVVIRSTRRRASRLRTTASLNNVGSASTGRDQASLTLSVDSPLQQNDVLHLRARRSLPAGAGHSSGYGMTYSIPHGPWTFALNLDRLDYLAPLPGSSAISSGRSDFYSLGLERAVWHSQSAALSASLQLSHKRLDNRFAGRQLALQSPTLTTLDGGVNLVWRDSALWSASLGFSQGLGWFGADTQAAHRRAPEPRFRKYSASLWQRREARGLALRWDSQLSLQYSPVPLPAVEQMAVADGSAVRGFRDTTVSGASGAVWRNTLSLPLPGRAPLELRPFLGVDRGWSYFDHGSPAQRLSGASAGLQASWPHGQLELDYQRALQRSGTPHKALEPGYWRARLTLVF